MCVCGVCVCVCVCVCMHVCVCVCMHVCMYACVSHVYTNYIMPIIMLALLSKTYSDKELGSQLSNVHACMHCYCMCVVEQSRVRYAKDVQKVHSGPYLTSRQ